MNWTSLRNPALVASVLLMGSAALGMKAAIDRYRIYLQKLPVYAEHGRVLRAIPAETAGWVRVGADHEEAPETLEVLGTENYLTRVYREKSPPGATPRVLNVHLAYYTGMIDTVPHVPDRCLVGAGLSINGGPWVLPIPLNAADWRASDDAREGETLNTTRLSNEWSTAGGGRRVNLPIGVSADAPMSLRVSEFGGIGRAAGQRYFAGYFFIANGGWVSSAEGVRFLAFNLTDDYAYYLKVQIGSSDVSSPEELAELSGRLLDDLLGEIMTCTPDWAKVRNGDWPPDNPKKNKPGAAAGRS